MKKVKHPLKRRTSNPEVGNLQNVLQLLLDRGLILQADKLKRQSLSRAIGRDRSSQTYSLATAEVVGIFQRERNLEFSGMVDELTAKALNGILHELGVLKKDDQDNPLPAGSKYSVRLVSTGSKKTLVLKAVREITKLGLKEAKERVDGLGVVAEDLSHVAAKKIQEKLASAGAKSEILPSSNPQPVPKPKPEEPKPEPLEPGPTPIDSSEPDGFIVFGQVFLSNGKPVVTCTVRAFDRDLRTEQLLGETRTDAKGSYKIAYTKEQFKRAGKGIADLVVRAYNPVGKLLVESDIHFNASAEKRIDLFLPDSANVQPSEYELLVNLLTPLLENVSLSDLTKDDIWFLANKTGRSIEEIAYLAEDARLAQKTGMPEAVFFGLASEEVGILPTGDSPSHPGRPEIPVIDLATVLGQPVNMLVKKLESALGRHFIPVVLRDRLEEIRDQFESLRKDHNVESTEKRKAIGRIAGLDAKTADRVAMRMHGGNLSNRFWSDLVNEGVINASQLHDVRLTFELGEIVDENVRLVETLKKQSLPQIGGYIKSTRDLAVLDAQSWFLLLEENEIEAPAGQDNQSYARQIAWNVVAFISEV